jgi:rRNA maturation endonuclease Nob1
MSKKPDPWDAFFDQLIGGMAEGKIKLVSIRMDVCGKCKEGAMKGSPTPNWMNRTICDKCGHKASR